MTASVKAGISTAAAVSKAKPGETEYTVIPGDTLWGIAVAHKTTVPAICAANGITADKFIYPGQKLKILKN